MKKIIAYDLGTGGIKTSLFDVEGKSHGNTFRQYGTRYTDGDFHEQKPMDWWEGIVATTKLLMEKTQTDPADVVGLAISGHSLGVVPIDKEGKLLTEYSPIWSDKRAKKQAEKFFQKVNYEEWYTTTGNGFPSECYSIFKIMWYQEKQPEVYDNAVKFLGSKDFCNFIMTGVACTDNSYASGCGAYDLKKRAYVPAYIQAAGIREDLMPEILPSHATVGTLLPEIAQELGLTTETKVICGGVDNSCMSLGSKGNKSGRTYLSLGSSSWIAVMSEEPIVDPKNLPYVFDHCVEGLYVSSTSIFSGGNSFRWVRDNICQDLMMQEASGEIKDAYDEMNRLAAQSPIGANRLLFNPSMAGGSMIEESPNIVGGYAGLNLGHTKSDLIRSAMEGITYNLYYALTVLTKYEPGINEMLLAGGGSKSPMWRQMFADVFGMNVIKTNIDQDAASLGAAALVAYGLGYWDSYDKLDELHLVESVETPDADRTAEYRKYYELSREMAHYMAALGDKLAEMQTNEN